MSVFAVTKAWNSLTDVFSPQCPSGLHHGREDPKTAGWDSLRGAEIV